MSDWSIEEAERVYGVSQWGGGYFQIGENGNVHITPVPEDPSIRIDFNSVIEDIRKEGVQFPVVVRFHDILRSQVAGLNKAFRSSIEEAEYQGQYQGVYPVKVKPNARSR